MTAYFYTKHEIGLRMAYWFGFAAVAGAFGGLIAFGVQHIQSSVASWRILFIIEVDMLSGVGFEFSYASHDRARQRSSWAS
jgi:hypothetical protein